MPYLNKGALLAFFYLTAIQVLHTCNSTSQKYNQSLQLDADGKYIVYWAHNATHITFEVHVKTRGYVGFGISSNGSMYPADMVVGWVKEGKAYFSDRHATAYTPPKVDTSQDWLLLKGEENDYGTILEFVRELDTCDQEDMVINDQTVRLIYSYHPDDPDSETSLPYHEFERRGTKSVSLLSISQPPASLNDLKIIEFRNRNYLLPAKPTTYLCTGFQMPDIGGKHHMIGFEAVITPENAPYVHHIAIERCEGSHPDFDMKTEECEGPFPKDWPKCSEIFAGWVVGGGPFYFPEEVGYSVGGPTDSAFYVMQMHYNNPRNKSGIFDNSGMRMKLTSKLRRYDAGAMEIGYLVSNYQVIPPQESAFISRGYCAPQCFKDVLNETNIPEIKVFATIQHAHTLSTAITTRHFRNGIELEPLVDDPNYDFFLQEARPITPLRTILPGDSFVVECTYNSMGRNQAAFGGYSTGDEMCKTLLFFYPAIPLQSCSSFPIFDTYNVTDLHQDFLQMNWEDPHVKDEFKQKLADSSIMHYCISKTNDSKTFQVYNFEEKVQPFVREDHNQNCQVRPYM